MRTFLGLFLSIFLLSACSTQVFVEKNELEQMLNDKEFTFMARRAYPSTNDVQRVMNGFPNTSASRMLELDYGYTLVLKNNVLEVNLPYFGRAFRSHYGKSDAGYKFTSKDFEINFHIDKGNKQYIVISPKDVEEITQLSLQIYGNGSAYLVINANDRLPISYNGYLMKN